MDNLDLTFDTSDFEMKDLGPFGEDRHKLFANDLPLIAILLTSYCYLIQICYETKENGEYISETAEETRHSVNQLLELMKEKAEAEHPGADFLKGYSLTSETYPDSKKYPPSIEMKDNTIELKNDSLPGREV